MRKIIFLLPVFLLFISSCHKDGNDQVATVHGPQTLPGSWEYRSYYGGYGPTGGGTSEPGNGNIWTFTDNTYTYYPGDDTQQSGTYTLTTAPNPNSGEITPAILFDGTYTMCYSIKDDTLTLYRGMVAADGTVETYARIANAGTSR